MPTADLLTRRPATCRPAQLPTCRLASWPAAAPTAPTMTVRGMAIAITHAMATRTATGGRTLTIYPNPAAQDAPRPPDLILEDMASKGARVDKRVRTPKPPPIPSSTLIWGAGGDQHSLQVSTGFEYIVHALSVAMACFVVPLTSTPLTTSAGRGPHKPCKSISGP